MFRAADNASGAPVPGDIAEELTLELSEYCGCPSRTSDARLAGATESFTAEWQQHVPDARDERAVHGSTTSRRPSSSTWRSGTPRPHSLPRADLC